MLYLRSVPFAATVGSRISRTAKCKTYCTKVSMGKSTLNDRQTMRIEQMAGNMAEIIDLHAETPSLQIIFIPGNPGIISFYEIFLKALFQQFGGKASVTAIGHIAHTSKDWHDGDVFSLEEQIEHKVQILQKRFLNVRLPMVLVGHSIGAYIALHILKRFPDKVGHVVGLYPFLAINTDSSYQSLLRWCARQQMIRNLLSNFARFVGRLPKSFSRGFVAGFVGHGWSKHSIDVACQYIFQYSLVQNFMYMGMTEFQKLQRNPDWQVLKEKQDRISLLFGVDDHWGPLTLFDQISKEAPDLDLEIEREGHKHAYCCTEVGSYWAAAYCGSVISKALQISILTNILNED